MSYPNHEQQAVLDHRAGTLLVLAPAGTGKTRVMADRLAAAIRAGVAAEETLAVTFTNRAAAEMRRAVAASCGEAARHCRIHTFHGLCAWILRTEARSIGLPVDFVIYDEQDSIDLLRSCLGDSDGRVEDVHWLLSQLKSDCPAGRLTLGEIPRIEHSDLTDVFAAYHRSLADRHALDFADLVYRTRAMFARLDDKRQKWSRRFRWIQIDEVQDTHLSEYEVIRVLGSPPAEIAFFGDLDQTIYEWRGSKPDEVIGRLGADFPPLRRLSLTHNYRSTKTLLKIADCHAACFAHRRTANLPAPGLAQGEPAEVFREFMEFAGDALLVGHNIRFDLAMVAAHAKRLGIRFAPRRWADTLDLSRRLLDLEAYDLGSVCSSLGTAAKPSHRALADAEATAEVLQLLQPALAKGEEARARLCARHGKLFVPIARQLSEWRTLAGEVRPGALCQTILHASGLADHYAKEPRRLANLAQFIRFFEENDDPRWSAMEALDELTRRVALAKNVDHLDPGDTRIPVITVHQSKGLEFDHVFIAGLCEDEFPGYYAKRDGKIEEEKRLFYVALTRAKRSLFLSSHQENESGYAKPPSSFLTRLGMVL